MLYLLLVASEIIICLCLLHRNLLLALRPKQFMVCLVCTMCISCFNLQFIDTISVLSGFTKTPYVPLIFTLDFLIASQA